MTSDTPQSNLRSAPGQSTVARRPSLIGQLVALGGVVASCMFLANIGAGFLFEIPDNLPFLGNLDEVFFSGVLLASLNHLGIPLIPNFRAGAQPRNDTRIDGPR